MIVADEVRIKLEEIDDACTSGSRRHDEPRAENMKGPSNEDRLKLALSVNFSFGTLAV